LSGEKTNFEDAVARFQNFLKTNKYPSEIVWVQPDDVLLTGKRLVYVRVSAPKVRQRMAKQICEEGMEKKRGVLLGTICELGATTCAYVWAPANDDEAVRALMPVDLKLSAKTGRIRGVSVESGIWWACLKLRYRKKQILREELFR
jgi:hypothetical protein